MPLRFSFLFAPGSGSNPGQGTLATSVSALGGDIVGYYYDPTSTLHSFDDRNGTFTTLPPVAGVTPIANGVNDLGQIVGFYSTASSHGFLYSGGSYMAIDDPHADSIIGTEAFGINDAGQIVGQYFDGSVLHGFVDTNGSFANIDPPGSTQTQAYAINNAGVIAGSYFDGAQHGFIDNNGSFTTLNDPSADSGGTFALGINDHDEVVGYYMRAGVKNGFLWRDGVFTDLEQTQAAAELDIFSTVADGITDSGQIVGYALQNGTAETLGFITSALRVAPGDFSGDNRSDLLWRQSSGTLVLWEMNGGTIVASPTVTLDPHGVIAVPQSSTPDSSWSIVGIGDFFANNTSAILWRQNAGPLTLWPANDGFAPHSVTLLYQNQTIAPDASWIVAATADFTGDGAPEVLWRQSSGTLALWQMSGSVVSQSSVPTYNGSAVTPDASWSIAGTGDFTGDGKADILWRQSTGMLALWQMNGAVIVQRSAITFNGGTVAPDASWTLAGVGDFDGDGHADMLWRQASTGTVAEWLMNGSTVTSSAAPTFQGQPVSPDSSWSIVQIGDFNNDGNNDVLWRQNTTGVLDEWLMKGATITASNTLAFAPDASWQVQSKPTNFG
jgi:probable HAF family extracellular repeat protein